MEDPSTHPAPRAFEEVLTDAEDLLQDAVLRAFRSYRQLREPSAARSWLFTILVRTHLNRVRARRRRAETIGADLDQPAFEAALAEWVPLRSPAEEAEAHQLGPGRC